MLAALLTLWSLDLPQERASPQRIDHRLRIKWILEPAVSLFSGDQRLSEAGLTRIGLLSVKGCSRLSFKQSLETEGSVVNASKVNAFLDQKLKARIKY